MKNNLKSFSFAQGVSQISHKLANAAKTAQDFTKEELHKYMTVKFNGTSSTFDSLVGDYDIDSVDISGMSISKAQAVLAMNAFINAAKTVELPFAGLMHKNAELAINPTGYIATDKLGEVNKIPMIRGLPGTESKAMILAHSSLTVAMITSSPEVDKETINGVQKRQMKRSVPTDPTGRFYPPVDIINLIDPLEANYDNGENILSVRAKILTQAKDAGNLMDVGAISLSALDSVVVHLKQQKRWQEKWNMFDCVRPISDPGQIKLYKDAGVDPIQLMPYKQFPTFAVANMDQLWTYLESHRDIRGTDAGKISPLTHAVYYGELDNSYRQVLGTADILYMMTTAGTNAVYHSLSTYFKGIWSVVQLNVPLITTSMNNPPWSGEEYGAYTYAKTDNFKKTLRVLSIDCINTQVPTRNSKTKVWEYSPTRETSIERINTFFSQHVYAAVKIYPYPELWADFPDRVFPSLHAHSGVVWVTNFGASPYTYARHIERVVKANVYKTYYPCYLQRFPASDILAWPTVYVKRTVKRKVHLGFEVLFTDGEVKFEGIDITSTDVKQKNLAAADAKLMDTGPEVKKYSAMKAGLEKKLAAQPPPASTPRAPTKDSHFDNASLDDENQFGDTGENYYGISGEDDGEEEVEDNPDDVPHDGDSVDNDGDDLST